LRTDYFVEIIRQPVFVLGQQAVAFHRSLDFADFARDVSIFNCFSAFCHFRPKLPTRDEARRLNFAKLPDLLRQLKLSCRGERSWIEK
jgi:hypothetical protein